MEAAPQQTPKPDSSSYSSICYEKNDKNHSYYSIEIKLISKNIEIIIIDKDSVLSGNYKISLSTEDFQKLNRYFKQFDTINEIFELLSTIKEIKELTTIDFEKNFITYTLDIPYIPNKSNKNIKIVIPGEEMKEKDILMKLCEKVKKISLIEKKINFIFSKFGIIEEDFEIYEKSKEEFSKFKNDISQNSFFSEEDFAVVQVGISKKLNKKIKSIKLLYKASIDGDAGTQFHKKCNNIPNTVTFVKAKNGKKFGGFANKEWSSNNSWNEDKNSFVFSLDSKECFYYNSGYGLYGYTDHGPRWGNTDLFLYNQCRGNSSSQTTQASYDYKGKINALSGGSNFQVEDYETYQLDLEE